MTLLTWIGILLCLSQSALFSGLNLALFSLSKLELEVEARKGNPRARRVLALRNDANFALVTVLWGNVSVNVLLALLSGSVMAGVAAFLFSTLVITVFAEIIPQAYFSRNALRVASLMSPVLRFYQILLYPIARPTALVLDAWLGGEEIRYPLGEPRLVIRSNDFLREALFEPERFNPYRHCHRPILVREPKIKLGGLIQRLQVLPSHLGDDILDHDIILLWNGRPRVVTGTDILGRLLRGIVRPPSSPADPPEST